LLLTIKHSTNNEQTMALIWMKILLYNSYSA
jgi:hypothetical protein